MDYVLPHLVTIDDLFCNFDYTKFKGEGNIKRKYKCADKKALVRKVFMRYMQILITDIIQGGKVFIFPTQRFMELRMRRLPMEQFIAARQSGAYAGVDILMSDRKCYELVVSYKYHNLPIEKCVKLSHNYRDMIVEKINTGYKYC